MQAPIFHVNGDDPEACIRAARMAYEYRRNFLQAGCGDRHVLLSPARVATKPTTPVTRSRFYIGRFAATRRLPAPLYSDILTREGVLDSR